MSKYAAIPIENAGMLKEHYSIATPATWQIDEHYAGVEDRDFSEGQRQDITDAGGIVFEDAEEFHNWFNNV